MSARVTVVVMTRNRREELLVSLERLATTSGRPPVVVVDNGSADGTPGAVAAAFPDVQVLALGRNRGAAARTPYVAFSDDDSWWAAGALDTAADVLDGHPRLGLLAARVLCGDDQLLDPVSVAMAASPLPSEAGLPGPPVLGFVACGSVVRRSAYLGVGGFDELVFFPGEETLLSMDLAADGWQLAYVDAVTAIHHPSPVRDVVRRRVLETRSELVSTWLRRPPDVALARTRAALNGALDDPGVRRGVVRPRRRCRGPWPGAAPSARTSNAGSGCWTPRRRETPAPRRSGRWR